MKPNHHRLPDHNQSVETFNAKLQTGFRGERAVADWLNRRGYNTLPVYPVGAGARKTPRLFTPDGWLTAPDMLAFNCQETIWVEIKVRTSFSWHFKSLKWVTGIERNIFQEYCKVNHRTPFQVWLLFLQLGGRDKGSELSPSGLFGNTLDNLIKNINHQSDWCAAGIGNGMVYWAVDSLIKYCDLPEVLPTHFQQGTE